MDSHTTNHTLTAAEAVDIFETYERRRAGHCVTIMDDVLDRIRKEARSGNRSYMQEAVGAGVNMEAYVNELTHLGYKVRPATKQENRLPRSIMIEW